MFAQSLQIFTCLRHRLGRMGFLLLSKVFRRSDQLGT